MSIKDVNEYLDTVHHIDKTLVGDPTKVVVKSEYGFTMREVMCNLLAGRGLKIPNIQVCVSVNVKSLLGYPDLPEQLKSALTQLDQAFDSYLEHTSIDAILGRINKTVNEISQVANMINFCASPIQPIEIPNVLENLMDSYLGAGKDLIDSVGTMLEPGGCLTFDPSSPTPFNASIFNGGILKEIGDKWDRITDGSITENELNVLVDSITNIRNQFTEQMDSENSTTAILSAGGSQFDGDVKSGNMSMGVMFDAESAGVQGVAQIANNLKATYDQLAGYPVKDKDGNVYKNIFETFLEPALLELLEKDDNPVPSIPTSDPVYDYCGNVIGYTRSSVQGEQEKSDGAIPINPPPDSPGFNGAGLADSDPFDSGGSSGGGSSGGTTTITNITQTGAGVEVIGSESSMISLQVQNGTIAVRSDQGSSYVKVADSGTIADWQSMSPALTAFMSHLNSQSSDGIIVKSNGVSRSRTITGTTNQISVQNGNGVGGDIVLKFTDNAVFPGTASIGIPVGTTSQRGSAEVGKLRYNSTTNRLETYVGGTLAGWRPLATGDAGVSDALNLGNGVGIYAANNSGTLTFKSLIAGDGIQLSASGTEITLSSSVTGSSVGSGASVFQIKTGDTLSFRSVVGTNNVTVTENSDTITISGDENTRYATASTTNAVPTELLVNSSRIAPPLNTTWFVTITVVGRRTNGNGKIAIKRECIIDNTGGSVTMINDESNSVIYANDVNNAWDFDVSDAGGIFTMLVTGEIGFNIDWKAKINIVSV